METKIQEIDPSNATDFECAREIMGRNLISPSQVEGHLCQHSSHSRSKRIPFSEQFLRENSQNSIIIRGIPFSIEGLYKRVLKINPHLEIFSDTWFIREKFAIEEKVEPVWYLMQKKVNDLSLNKTYAEA